MSRNYVFLGPSLSLAEARTILPDAVYLPPVKMGDVQTLIHRSPDTICIIDGFFERVPAVWHKEILYALSRGIRVIGASSMGALRAAELHSFGMEGVGTIFEAYRDGIIVDDDEVALIHGSSHEGYRALSEPLVNIRFALADEVRSGSISDETADRLLCASQRRFYPERSWPRVFEDAQTLRVQEEEISRLRAAVDQKRPNAKRADARLALAAVNSIARPTCVAFDFEPTMFWEQLVATTIRTSASVTPFSKHEVMADEVLRHSQLVLADFCDVQRHALLNHLLVMESERLGISVNDEEIGAATDWIRRENGLLSADSARVWFSDQHIGDRELREIARITALFEKVFEFYSPILDRADSLTLELKRQGRYGTLASDAQRKQRAVVCSASEHELLKWHTATVGPIIGSVDQHAQRRGFDNRVAFLDELAATYAAAQQQREHMLKNQTTGLHRVDEAD